MTNVQSTLLGYLFRNGVKNFSGKISPNGNISLSRISKESQISFDELYTASQELEAKELLKTVNVVKEAGSNKVIAVGVEITKNGIEDIKD